MKYDKSFDCVAYKRAIQEKHLAATQGLSHRERARQRQQWLNQSDNPAVRLWRKMNAKQAPVASR